MFHVFLPFVANTKKGLSSHSVRKAFFLIYFQTTTYTTLLTSWTNDHDANNNQQNCQAIYVINLIHFSFLLYLMIAKVYSFLKQPNNMTGKIANFINSVILSIDFITLFYNNTKATTIRYTCFIFLIIADIQYFSLYLQMF